MEVIIAVAVVAGLGTALAIGAAPSEGVRLRSAAAGLARVVEEARWRAAETGRPAALAYDPATRRVLGPYDAFELPRGITLGPEPIRVEIRPSGASEGAVFVLAGDQAQARVRLDWLTGRVTVEP